MPPLASGPWTPPFLRLEFHALIEEQIKSGLQGGENTVLFGPRGVGKTTAVRFFVERARRAALSAQLAGGTGSGEASLPTCDILFYETSRATGPKTALSDLYLRIINRPLSKRSKQDWSPTTYIEQIVERLMEDQIGLVVIDEAQMIDAANIDLLRQVPDAAERHGHSVRLFLVGNEELVGNVRATGQAGERFPTILKYPPLTPKLLSQLLPEFHPDLAALKATLPAKAWRALEQELLTIAQGSMRRLRTMIASAHELARSRHRPMSERDLRFAIAKIS